MLYLLLYLMLSMMTVGIFHFICETVKDLKPSSIVKAETDLPDNLAKIMADLGVDEHTSIDSGDFLSAENIKFGHDDLFEFINQL